MIRSVFVLGAGASKMAGAPLMNDFLETPSHAAGKNGDNGVEQYQARISTPCGTIYTVPAILTANAKLAVIRVGPNSGRLMWSATGLGPWTTVEGAFSPYDLTFQNAAKFLRLNTKSAAAP